MIKIIFLFLIAFVPSMAWLSYHLRQDNRPEPRRFLIFSFALGGLSVLLASQAENVWFAPWVKNQNQTLNGFVFIFFFPFIEEIYKFMAARISTLKNKYFLDENTDPMVYIIAAALGFAAIENLRLYFLTIFGSLEHLSWQGLLATEISQTALISVSLTAAVRFLGTVFLHSLSSATLGYFWGINRLVRRDKREEMMFFTMPTGLISATIIHALYNYLMINVSQNIFYPVAVLILLIFTGWLVRRFFIYLKSYQAPDLSTTN